jgi:hypothetical protein
VWWPGLKNSPTVTHACRKRRLKWVPSAWGIAGHLVSGGHKYGGLVLQVGRLGAGLTIQPLKMVFTTKGRPRPDLGCRAIWWWLLVLVIVRTVVFVKSFTSSQCMSFYTLFAQSANKRIMRRSSRQHRYITLKFEDDSFLGYSAVMVSATQQYYLN